MAKNYIQTISETDKLKLLHTFSDNNTFITYNSNSGVEGVIFDESSGRILEPTMYNLTSPPAKIDTIGYGVSENAPTNRGFVLGSNNHNTPYTLKYNDNTPKNYELETSLSFQFKVPQQQQYDIAIYDYETPYVVVDVEWIQVVGGVNTTMTKRVEGNATIIGKKWYYYANVDEDNATVVIKVYYKNTLMFEETYTHDTHDYNNSSADTVGDYLTFEDTLPVLDNVVGSLTVESVYTSIQEEIGWFPSKRDKTLLPSNFIGIYGFMTDRFSVSYFDTTKDINNGSTLIYSNGYVNVLLENNTLVYKLPNNFQNTNDFTHVKHTHAIDKDVGYATALTQKIYERVENTTDIYGNPVQRIYTTAEWNIYVDSKLVGNYKFNIPDFTTIPGLTSGFQIGVTPKITPLPRRFNKTDKRALHFLYDSVIVHIDNLALNNKLLSKETIRKLYIRQFSYKRFIELLKPIAYYDFNTLATKYISTINNSTYLEYFSDPHSTKQIVHDTSKKVYNKGVRYKGNIQIHSNPSRYNDSGIIDFSRGFSLVIWLKSHSADYVLFSERDAMGIHSGISLIVNKFGKLDIEYNNNRIITDLIITDSTLKMLAINYQHDNNTAELTVFVPDDEYNETYKIGRIKSEFKTPKYIAMLNDDTMRNTVDVELYSLGIFNRLLDTSKFIEMFEESIVYTIDGEVLFKNVPEYADVRITNYYTGELLGKVKTDASGEFTFTNIYEQDVLLIVNPNEGKMQTLGMITSTPNNK